eukprot:gene9273-9438_t
MKVKLADKIRKFFRHKPCEDALSGPQFSEVSLDIAPGKPRGHVEAPCASAAEAATAHTDMFGVQYSGFNGSRASVAQPSTISQKVDLSSNNPVGISEGGLLLDDEQFTHVLATIDSGLPEQQAAAAEALFNDIAQSNAGRQRAMQVGAVPILVHLLSSGPDNAKMYAAYTLSSLATMADCVAQIQAAGAIPALISVLSTCTMLLCKKGAMRALGQLALQHAAAADIVAAGGLPAMVALLKKGESSLVRRCLIALYYIGADKDDLQQAIGAAGALPQLLALTRSDSPEVQAEATDVLKVLCRNAACGKSLVQLGAIEDLVRLAHGGATTRTKGPQNAPWSLAESLTTSSSRKAREHAIHELEQLAVDDPQACRTVFSDVIVLSALLNLLSSTYSSSTCRAAARALYKLGSDAALLKCMADAGAVAQLLAAAPTLFGSARRSVMKLLLAMAGNDCCSHRFQGPQVVLQVTQAGAAKRASSSFAGGTDDEAAVLDKQEEQQREQQAATSTQPSELDLEPPVAVAEAWELLLTVCQTHTSALEGFQQFTGGYGMLAQHLQHGSKHIKHLVVQLLQLLARHAQHQQHLLRSHIVPQLLLLYQGDSASLAAEAGKVMELLSGPAAQILQRSLSGKAGSPINACFAHATDVAELIATLPSPAPAIESNAREAAAVPAAAPAAASHSLLPRKPVVGGANAGNMLDSSLDIVGRGGCPGRKCRLGEGGFGVVYKAVMHGVDEVAVKLVKATSPNRQELELFLKEVQTLASLHHRNIVQFYGACLEPGNLFFVTELMKGGDLYSALRHHSHTMRWERLGRKVALDVALGLNYLHSQRPPMMHRDLKSPNVLLSEEGVAKIADVGMVRSQVKDLVTAQPVMTPLWAAPEVVRHERASIKADLWSFGIIMWELFSGEDITEYQPLAISRQAGAVEFVWETQQPYQHCLALPADCSPDTCVQVQNVMFSHYSKSVANNYCIFAQGGLLQLEGCDINSRSGVGVGVEGGQLVLQQCRVHDCQRHGVGVFGALEGGGGSAVLEQSVIDDNKLNGVLVRDGGQLKLRNCQVVNNGGYGMQLQDCTASLHDNILTGNRLGSFTVDAASELTDG